MDDAVISEFAASLRTAGCQCCLTVFRDCQRSPAIGPQQAQVATPHHCPAVLDKTDRGGAERMCPPSGIVRDAVAEQAACDVSIADVEKHRIERAKARASIVVYVAG